MPGGQGRRRPGEEVSHSHSMPLCVCRPDMALCDCFLLCRQTVTFDPASDLLRVVVDVDSVTSTANGAALEFYAEVETSSGSTGVLDSSDTLAAVSAPPVPHPSLSPAPHPSLSLSLSPSLITFLMCML